MVEPMLQLIRKWRAALRELNLARRDFEETRYAHDEATERLRNAVDQYEAAQAAINDLVERRADQNGEQSDGG